jgi:hypothetical protein
VHELLLGRTVAVDAADGRISFGDSTGSNIDPFCKGQGGARLRGAGRRADDGCSSGLARAKRGEAGEHGAEASEETEERLDLRGGREAKEKGGLEGGGRLGGLAPRAPEASGAVGTGAARGLGDAEVRGEQRAAELSASLP